MHKSLLQQLHPLTRLRKAPMASVNLQVRGAAAATGSVPMLRPRR